MWEANLALASFQCWPGLLLWRPLLQHARSLPERQLDPRLALSHAVEDATRFVEVAASEQHVNHTLPVARPLLDLVEVAPVGMGWIVGFFVGPVAHCTPLRYLSPRQKKAPHRGGKAGGTVICQSMRVSERSCAGNAYRVGGARLRRGREQCGLPVIDCPATTIAPV